jgi:hypothetical protein
VVFHREQQAAALDGEKQADDARWGAVGRGR